MTDEPLRPGQSVYYYDPHGYYSGYATIVEVKGPKALLDLDGPFLLRVWAQVADLEEA